MECPGTDIASEPKEVQSQSMQFLKSQVVLPSRPLTALTGCPTKWFSLGEAGGAVVRHIASAQLVIDDVIEVETVHFHLLHLAPDGHSPHLPEAHEHQHHEAETHHHSWVHYRHYAVALEADVRAE